MKSKLRELYVFISENPQTHDEFLICVMSTPGDYGSISLPLATCTKSEVEYLSSLASGIGKATSTKVKLARFTGRVIIKELT